MSGALSVRGRRGNQSLVEAADLSRGFCGGHCSSVGSWKGTGEAQMVRGKLRDGGAMPGSRVPVEPRKDEIWQAGNAFLKLTLFK